MRIAKSGALALLFMTWIWACTAGCTGSRPAAKGPIQDVVAEFQLKLYDGREFEGRLLLGVTDYEPVVISRELFMFDDVVLEKVRACGKTELLPYKGPGPWEGPAWESARRSRIDFSGVVTLEKGQWHGANVNYPLFDLMWPWPNCFEADMVIFAADGRVAARLPIHVERTDKPKETPDGGAPPCPPPPAPDGGAEPPKPPIADGGAP